MHIKRIYKPEELKVWLEKTKDHPLEYPKEYLAADAPSVDYIEASNVTNVWKISQKTLDKGLKEGWLFYRDNKLIVKAKPELVYNIKREPGIYCCHCGDKLPNNQVGFTHVAILHKDIPSPDQNHPHGFGTDNFFVLHLEGYEEGKPKKPWWKFF